MTRTDFFWSAVVGLVFVLLFYWGTKPQPAVYISQFTKTPLECKSAETDWERQPIYTDICQEVLANRHNIIWVK